MLFVRFDDLGVAFAGVFAFLLGTALVLSFTAGGEERRLLAGSRRLIARAPLGSMPSGTSRV